MTRHTDAPAHHPPPAGVDLVCAGLASVDTIVVVPAWPDPDGRVVVERWETAYGGGAATAAVAAARSGARVAFAGIVGDDDEGRAAAVALAAAGVDPSAVVVRPGATPRSVIVVDRGAGTRAILHAPGVAGATDPLEIPPAPWTHVDHAGYRWAAAVLRERLSVDAGNPIPGLSLAGLGLYAPTKARLLERYPGRGVRAAMAAALDDGAERVAVTLGADGALAADRTGAWRAPGVSVEVVSTLGAGDVFHGVLAGSMATGRSLAEALARANVAAALSCRALDGRGAIPDADELAGALQEQPPVERITLDDA